MKRTNLAVGYSWREKEAASTCLRQPPRTHGALLITQVTSSRDASTGMKKYMLCTRCGF